MASLCSIRARHTAPRVAECRKFKLLRAETRRSSSCRATAKQGPGLLPSFDPPALLTDLEQQNLPGWSDIIAQMCDSGRTGDPNDPFDHPRPQFFNATKFPVGADFKTKDISWTAFPRIVQVSAPSDEARWKLADAQRDVQDEYCEWSVTRNANGKITRVTFTCEGPEYWEHLASVQPETVLKLYQEHVNIGVQEEDIFTSSGAYINRNKWNTDTVNGAMHLVQRNNTLGAEVELGAAASRVRLDADGDELTDPQDLIQCGRYGNPQRFSDPFIGSEVNALARAGALVTIANPVALHFDGFFPAGFDTPDGSDASDYWTWTRGEGGYHVRGMYEVPASKGFVVGDITINGKGNIRYGSMLADYIRIKLTGLACNFNAANVDAVQGCVGDAPRTNPQSFDANFNESVDATSARPSRGFEAANGRFFEDMAAATAAEDAEVLRLITGIDSSTRPMTPAEAASLLKDPFAQLVLLPTPPGDRPQSLDAVSKVIMAGSGAEYTDMSFFVGDGAQISHKKFPTLNRSFRFVWVRSLASVNPTAEEAADAMEAATVREVTSDIMVVASPNSASTTSFLQVAAWDDVNRVFNFYARLDESQISQNGGTTGTAGVGQWVWNGSSLHAFEQGSRGEGPFDGHINGSLVMKELRLPWNNWHSSVATIDKSIAPDDPLRSNPFFQNKSVADVLQALVVEPGIAAWTRSRLEKAFQLDGTIIQTPKYLLQHVFTSTTINFTSSVIRSSQTLGTPQPVKLPVTFFVNSGALGDRQLNINIDTSGLFMVPYDTVYKPTIQQFGFELVGSDNSNSPVSIPGDTFFAFLVPEPAKEDVQVISNLMAIGLLSSRFVTCALMVDFANPVYSPVRLELMQYVPDTGKKQTLEGEVVSAILEGAAAGNAAALEFKKWYDVDPAQLSATAGAAIQEYLTNVDARSTSQPGFQDYIRLAEQRRRDFTKFNSDLNEFSLTLPRTNIPANAPPLKMMPDGTVAMEDPHSEQLKALKASIRREKVKCEGMAISFGCPFAKSN